MTKRTKTVVSVLLFVLVFGGLLLTATFCDLQISKILTADILAEHNYYTNDPFGTLFEILGSGPVYLMISFAAQILFWHVMRKFTKRGGKELLELLLLVISTVSYYAFAKQSTEYFLQHVNAEPMQEETFVMLIELSLALMGTIIATIAVRNYKEESIEKLVMFAFAVLCVAAVANILVGVVKGPVGRMRFRAMNTIGDFSKFTPWYVVNGAMEDEELMRLFGTTDACRSFPSGHTCAAGMSYCLVMLIPALNIENKWKKAALWILPIVFTGTVAVSRIMVGAHFMSDVLMGGTISFLSMIIFREIFVVKGANVKALFGKE